MLGQLRLSVTAAIDQYVKLTQTVFSNTKHLPFGSKFSATKLEKAMKDIISKYGSGNADMRMLDKKNGQTCKM